MGQNLFADLATFAELEARIAALGDEQSRGDAFEVFAEAYLATQRKHDAANVWPLTSVPTQTLQTLGLAAKDYGVDGVFKTLLGHFNAYQVKFRTNRPALTWRELSTFVGLADSPHIRSRVLFTNCDEVASILNDRQGFFCIRGSDLDRLESDDFRAIEAWLADATFVAPKKEPQPHQIEALDALLPALETHNRVSAIMACGTGKTLIALWAVEHRQAARVLVLVPSLALLRQILHEWLRETRLPHVAYLCICSDHTVKDGLDSISTTQSDLDFQVSTEATSVREFLDAPFVGTRIVFSTYQSARVVGAALKPGEAFDLAVFDEAHKTAGRDGRTFAFALEDTNLPVSKRLFLTATPRHYNPHQRDGEGDAQLVFSMDRPDVYGAQAYRLTFAEAARRGIIVFDWESDAMERRWSESFEQLKQYHAQHGNADVPSRWKENPRLASWVSFQRARQKKGLLSTEQISALDELGITWKSRDVGTWEDRLAEIAAFKAKHGHCDIPTVFPENPKLGRFVNKMRTDRNRGALSPDRLAKLEAVGFIWESSRGEDNWQKHFLDLQKYKSQHGDSVVPSIWPENQELANWVARQRQAKKTGKLDAEKVRLLEANAFKWTVAGPREPWEVRYKQLLEFKSIHGHCDVPTRYPDNPLLGVWVVNQRSNRKLGKLTDEQQQLLSDAGFNWQKLVRGPKSDGNDGEHRESAV